MIIAERPTSSPRFLVYNVLNQNPEKTFAYLAKLYYLCSHINQPPNSPSL